MSQLWLNMSRMALSFSRRQRQIVRQFQWFPRQCIQGSIKRSRRQQTQAALRVRLCRQCADIARVRGTSFSCIFSASACDKGCCLNTCARAKDTQDDNDINELWLPQCGPLGGRAPRWMHQAIDGLINHYCFEQLNAST